MTSKERKDAVAAEAKALRAQRGWPIREVAEKLGWNHETYRQRELGVLAMTGSELAQLARLYGLPIREAFPSYEPTEGEKLLAEELGDVA